MTAGTFLKYFRPKLEKYFSREDRVGTAEINDLTGGIFSGYFSLGCMVIITKLNKSRSVINLTKIKCPNKHICGRVAT